MHWRIQKKRQVVELTSSSSPWTHFHTLNLSDAPSISTMSSFYLSSSPIFKLQWHANAKPKPSRPIVSLPLSRLHANCYSWRLSCNLTQHGLELEETVEEDEIPQVLELPTEEEPNFDKETTASPSKMLRKKKGDEESLDDRFKLRNGKEVALTYYIFSSSSPFCG